jgi:hypothetical protein
VETLPGPVLQLASLTGGNITLTWTGLPSRSYQIQSATELSNPNWTNSFPVVTASNSVASISGPVGPAAQRFYRVVLLPSP